MVARGFRARLSITLTVLSLAAALCSLTYAVVRNADNTRAINVERHQVAKSNCEDVNRRHDATIRELDALIARAPTPEKARAQENRAATVLILNALVPKRNCEVFADSVVQQ